MRKEQLARNPVIWDQLRRRIKYGAYNVEAVEAFFASSASVDNCVTLLSSAVVIRGGAIFQYIANELTEYQQLYLVRAIIRTAPHIEIGSRRDFPSRPNQCVPLASLIISECIVGKTQREAKSFIKKLKKLNVPKRIIYAVPSGNGRN